MNLCIKMFQTESYFLSNAVRTVALFKYLLSTLKKIILNNF